MIPTISLLVLTELVAFASSYYRSKALLTISMLLLFVFAGIRKNYGWDYAVYENMYALVSKMSLRETLIYSGQIEIGFIFLLKIASNILHIKYQLFLIIEIGIMLVFVNRVIVRYCSPRFYWLAVLIYIFNNHLYFAHFSILRQSIASIFIFLAIQKTLKDKTIASFLALLIAVLFHYTSILLLPVLIAFRYLERHLTRVINIIIYILITLNISNLLAFISNNQIIVASKYSVFFRNVYARQTSYPQIALLIMIFIFFIAIRTASINASRYKGIYVYFLYYSIVSLGFPVLGRIDISYSILLLIIIPSIKTFNKYCKYIIYQMYIAFIIYGFLNFWTNESLRASFMYYQSIL